MFRWELLNFIIQNHKFERYLEVGTATLKCFNQVNCKLKVGMDPADLTYVTPEGGLIFGLTSDDFFAKQSQLEGVPDKFQLVFIDGLHLFEQAYNDIINSWNSLEVGGYILLHDCIPLNRDAAQRAPVSPQAAWNGDVYRAILKFKDAYPDILCRVVNMDCGIGFIRKESAITLENDNANIFYYMGLDFDWLQAAGTEGVANVYRLGIVPVDWAINYVVSGSRPKAPRAVTEKEKEVQNMTPDGEVWTICELLRKMYKLAGEINHPKSKEIQELAKESVVYAKRMDSKLRTYKADYDSGWWQEK